MTNTLFKEPQDYPEYKRFTNKGQWDKEVTKDPEGNPFTEMTVISAFADPSLIMKYYERPYCYQKITTFVGMGLVGDYKGKLKKQYEMVEKIYEKTKNKTLEIQGSEGDHQKVFLLENRKWIKIIVGSPNFTYKATTTCQREGGDIHIFKKNQMTKAQEQYYKVHLENFQKTKEESSLFMSDLMENIEKKPEEYTEKQIIKIWINSDPGAGSSQKISELNKEIVTEMIENPGQKTIHIQRVPDMTPMEKKYYQDRGMRFENDGSGGIAKEIYLQQKDEMALPLMVVDMEKEKVFLGIGGKLKTRSNSEKNADAINLGLSIIERVVEEVDNADCYCSTKSEAKTVFYETLLYHFLTPFASILQEKKQGEVGFADPKGPKFLCLQGPSHNGKTTIVNILNKWLTGENYEGLNAADLKPKQIRSLITHGINSNTCFPIILDDLKNGSLNRKSSPIEPILKSHWENKWVPGKAMPQIIITTNEDSLPEWAKSRFINVRFNVRFQDTIKNQKSVHNTLSEDNDIFTYFAPMAIKKIKKMKEHNPDDLFIARECFKELYEASNRLLPEYFPQKPVQKLFDQDASLAWEMIHVWKNGKRTVNRINEQRYEFDDYRNARSFNAYLPQDIDRKISGKSISITSVKRYKKWIERGKSKETTGLLDRFSEWYFGITKR